MSIDTSIWFEKHRAREACSLRLFCIPHAGGAGYPYRLWMPHLPNSVDLFGVRLPGRGPRILEAAFCRMEPLVTVLSEAVIADTDVPFAVFGHSMGALIAFELCTRLAQHGLKASHLFVSATRAPHIWRGEKQLHLLPRDAFIRELRHFNGTAAEIIDDEETISSFLPLLRADLELVETYPAVARPPLSCPITALGGVGDTTVSEDELQEWSQYTVGAFRRVMFPGDHFFVSSEEAAVLRLISGTLTDL